MGKQVRVFVATMLGVALLLGVGSVSSLAQTSDPAGASSQSMPRASSSNNVQAAPILDQEEWKRAVASILRRHGSQLVGDLRLLELDGVFKAKIGFDLSPDGKVSNIRVVEGSGNSDVDAAARKIPETDAPFPAFTPDMSRDGSKKIVAPFVVDLKKPEPPAADPSVPTKAIRKD